MSGGKSLDENPQFQDSFYCRKVSTKKKNNSTISIHFNYRECINKVCEAAGLKTADKKRKVDKKVSKAIAEVPNMAHAGANVSLNVSSSNLTLTSLDDSKIIACHDMPHISFASGGDCVSVNK
jgi:SHC-transforming protein 1